MIRTFFALLISLTLLILSLPFGLIIFPFSKLRKYGPVPRFGIWWVQLMAKVFCKLGGCNYKISGQENIPEGPAIYVGNHQGNFDTFLLMFALGDPKIIMVKKEASYIPIAHIWLGIIKVVFVDRKHIKKAASAQLKMLDYLSKGLSLLYFPEGTRSQGPDMGSFKLGAFKAAVSAGVPIVPFVIDGTYKVYEQQRFLKKADVEFRILPPIPVNKGDDAKELATKTKELIQKELDEIRGEK